MGMSKGIGIASLFLRPQTGGLTKDDVFVENDLLGREYSIAARITSYLEAEGRTDYIS